MITSGLTEQEERELIILLGKVRQPWSPSFYNALAPMFRLPTTDLILVDQNRRVFMTKRPADDVYEPGWWHFPGTLVRDTDKSNSDSLERIGIKELGLRYDDLFKELGIQYDSLFLEAIKMASFICEGFSNSRRGPEINRYYLVRVTSEQAKRLGCIGNFVERCEFACLNVLTHHREIDIWNKI